MADGTAKAIEEVEEGEDVLAGASGMFLAVLWPAAILTALQPTAPALPQVPPYGILALRAVSRLAISLRSAGSVASGVQSGGSGGEILVRRVTAAGCGAAVCAILERCGEGFERIGDDGGAEEGAEFFGIGDGFDGVAEAVGDGSEAEIEGFDDGLAAGGEGAVLAAFEFAGLEALLDSFLDSFLAAFLAELLGESHGAGAECWVADTVNFADELGPVNWVGACEEEADETVEEAAGDMGEEVVVPDGVVEEAADGFGFEGAEDEDAVGGAADGVERDGGELDEAEGEVWDEWPEEV